MLLRLLLRATKWLTLVLVVFAIAMGLGTFVPRPFVESGPNVSNGEESRRILILSNPIHTDIALPADSDVLKALGFVSQNGLELDYPGVFWIIIGWGGRSFYIETPTWADMKPGPVFDAMTWDASVMHVRRAGNIPQDLEEVQTIDLSETAFEELLTNIVTSFKRNPNGDVTPISGAAYDEHDIFFEANGGFNAFMGCNTWTARMLRSAGMRTGIWTPLPINLNLSLTLHNQP